VASFPIRTYLATHETYVVINGEEVNKVEFDYVYNPTVVLMRSSFFSFSFSSLRFCTLRSYFVMTFCSVCSFCSLLSYFGLDTSKDLSTQMYSETLTWKDYFEQNAVESLK